MKYLFSVFLWLATILCFGQDADSLRKIVFSNALPLKRLEATVTLSAYLSKSKSTETFAIAKAGLSLATILKQIKPAALLLKDIGRAFYLNGKPDSAAYYYQKATEALNQESPKYLITADYADLANLYNKLKNYKKAIELYDTVLVYAPKNGSRQELMTALNTVGVLYESLSDYRTALDYYRQSYAISDSVDFVKKTKENTSEAYSRNFIGDVMGSIKQKEGTVQDILSTIDKKKTLNDTLALSINYFNLGVLYKSKRMFPQSLDALKNSMQYAAKISYTDMQSSAVNEIADLYEQTGDFKQALIYLKKQQELNTPDVKKHSKTVDELQTRYEITQREEQVLHQQLEIVRRNYWVAGVCIVLILMLFMGFAYYKQTQLKQRNIAMQAIMATEESERHRIAQDLHDSVSQTMMAAKFSLTAIGSELPFINPEQQKQFEKAISLVDDGFKEVRTISHNMMPWALHKTGLAKVVKQFIENISTNAVEISLFSRGFEEPFNDKTEIVLYRLLQESVNNVMKHAEASRVDISLIRDEENISLTIEDNGKGFDASRPEVYSGMGLNNLLSRVNFLNGKFEIDSEPGKGTLVSIYIPLGKRAL